MKLGFKFSYNVVSGSPDLISVRVGDTQIPAANISPDNSVHTISAVTPSSTTAVMNITANASASSATIIDIHDIGVCANQIPMQKSLGSQHSLSDEFNLQKFSICKWIDRYLISGDVRQKRDTHSFVSVSMALHVFRRWDV